MSTSVDNAEASASFILSSFILHLAQENWFQKDHPSDINWSDSAYAIGMNHHLASFCHVDDGLFSSPELKVRRWAYSI